MKANIKRIFVLFFLLFPGWMGDGYILAELKIELEAIYLNHNIPTPQSFKCDCHPECVDAIDIRKNADIDIIAPEWTKNRQLPAAYIKGSRIIVYAEFSSDQNITLTIGAEKKTGEFGDIKPRTVEFHETDPGRLVSFQTPFCVLGKAPDNITLFDQTWDWYYLENPQDPDSKKTIQSSTNKIYIVLNEPQSPWNNTGYSKPWANVLEMVCGWVVDKTKSEEAASQITKDLYDKANGNYSSDGGFFTGSAKCDFDLKTFMRIFPKVEKVSCYDMGKALVTFANIVGCDLKYGESCPFGKLKTIKLIGMLQDPNKDFFLHAFGMIMRQNVDEFGIFDASFKLCVPGCEYIRNKRWIDYKGEVRKPKQPAPCNPSDYLFKLGDNDNRVQKASFKCMVERARRDFKFNDVTQSEVEKVVSGVQFPSNFFYQQLPLKDMEKIWDEDIVSIKNIQNKKYSVTRQCWKKGKEYFYIIMVVGEKFEDLKQYLIRNYADWQTKPGFFEKKGHLQTPLGAIGNIGFLFSQSNKEKASPYRIDFIRDKVLFMIHAEGNLREEMIKFAGKLDSHLIENFSQDKNVDRSSKPSELPSVDFVESKIKEKINERDLKTIVSVKETIQKEYIIKNRFKSENELTLVIHIKKDASSIFLPHSRIPRGFPPRQVTHGRGGGIKICPDWDNPPPKPPQKYRITHHTLLGFNKDIKIIGLSNKKNLEVDTCCGMIRIKGCENSWWIEIIPQDDEFFMISSSPGNVEVGADDQ